MIDYRKHKVLAVLLALTTSLGMISPAGAEETEPAAEASGSAVMSSSERVQPPHTTYEIFTGSFADSNGDGIGDLNGIREHLDYINDGNPATSEDLGCDGIWLTPIFPSPTYHKYDAKDYMSIDPDFGTLDDFDALLKDCHQRGIRLYLDLAVNHTSVKHPWFQEAAAYLKKHGANPESQTVPGAYGITFPKEKQSECPYLCYYNFVTEPREGYTQLAGTDYYYESRFWEGMPDLNLDSDAVKEEISKITKFWLDRGVDGFRLDAVTSYYTDDKKKSIEFLSWLTDTIKSQKADAYIVGECWADEKTIADFSKSGIDSLFDFPFADQDGTIANTVRSENGALTWGNQMEHAEQLYAAANPDFVDAPFYTNHDMARSAGYYSYDDGTKAKLAGGMNLLMKGNAFVYYGEEAGLKGSGKDENKRAPMPWAEEDASVTAGPPSMDKTDLKYGTVADQIGDPDSILSYYREAIQLRSTYPAIAEGATKVLTNLSNAKVCVFTRTTDDGATLIAVNVGGEKAEIDLSDDPEADAFRNLAASLNAQSEESARAAIESGSGSGRGRRKGRGRRSQDPETETETARVAESMVLTSHLEGDTLTLPAYGIAILAQDSTR